MAIPVGINQSDADFFAQGYGTNYGGGGYSTTPQTTGIAGQNNIFGISPELQQQLFGGTDANGMQTQGIVPAAVGAGTALAQSWLGFQQYGLAKDAFNFQKDAFNKNFAMQEDAYNTAKANQQASAAAQNG